jgi:thioredoxin-related protein
MTIAVSVVRGSQLSAPAPVARGRWSARNSATVYIFITLTPIIIATNKTINLMKKTILILLLTAIYGLSNGQLLMRNAYQFSQLKVIADKLNAFTNYQADCDLVIISPMQGTLHSASTLITLKVPNDTLCGFYYYFKTHEEFKATDFDFIAFLKNAYYAARNNAIDKTNFLEEPQKFKETKFANGYYPAIHRSSFYLRFTPLELSKFINKSLADNDVIIMQRPDTLIGGKYCIKYVIKTDNSTSPPSTELCFEKESCFPIYYKSSSGGFDPQYIIGTLSNTKVDQPLPANYFSEENLFGRKLGKNNKKIRNKQLKIGELAPDWELPMLGKMIKRSNKELIGKYILLEFTGTWCTHCWDADKMMNRLEDEFNGNNKLAILSVFSTDIDNEEKITKFANEQKIKSTILYSAKSVGDKYYVISYPTFFIINPTGKLVLTIAGYSQDVENEISNYLRKNIK